MNTDKIIIYALSDPRRPSAIRYIGKTEWSLTRRLSGHLCTSVKREKTYKSNWILSLLRENTSPKIWPIEICDSDAWESRERYWISFFKPLGLLTNFTNGGEAGSFKKGHKLSPETIAKFRILRKGKTPSKQCIEAAKAFRTGRPLSEEAKNKISLANKGRQLTLEQKQRMIIGIRGRMGHPHTDETKEKLRRMFLGREGTGGGKKKIPVICIETGEKFLSVTEAANKKNLRRCKISTCLKNGRTTGGFHWGILR